MFTCRPEPGCGKRRNYQMHSLCDYVNNLTPVLREDKMNDMRKRNNPLDLATNY